VAPIRLQLIENSDVFDTHFKGFMLLSIVVALAKHSCSSCVADSDYKYTCLIGCHSLNKLSTVSAILS